MSRCPFFIINILFFFSFTYEVHDVVILNETSGGEEILSGKRNTNTVCFELILMLHRLKCKLWCSISPAYVSEGQYQVQPCVIVHF